jgi:hypothetical protein
MKCPECDTKLTTKNYDPEYEWYECPGCEGAFTIDEIQGGTDESDKPKNRRQQGDRSRSQGAKASGGRGPQRKDARRADKGVQEALRRAERKGPTAKGKKRRTEIAEDEEAVAAFEKEALKPVATQEGPKQHRDEIETKQIVNIWGDEFQDIYHDLGMEEIDEHNARDKALIIWREIHYGHSAVAREAEVPAALCKEHS